MPFATVADLRLVFEGSILVADEARVTEMIAATERRLQALVADVDARVAAGTLDSDLVKDVVRDAMLRRLRNPEGYQSETAGDYSYRYGSTAGSSAVAPFTAAEISMLRAGAGTTSPRTIRVATPGDGPATAAPDVVWH